MIRSRRKFKIAASRPRAKAALSFRFVSRRNLDNLQHFRQPADGLQQITAYDLRFEWRHHFSSFQSLPINGGEERLVSYWSLGAARHAHAFLRVPIEQLQHEWITLINTIEKWYLIFRRGNEFMNKLYSQDVVTVYKYSVGEKELLYWNWFHFLPRAAESKPR